MAEEESDIDDIDDIDDVVEEELAAKFERNMRLLPDFADDFPPLTEAFWPPLDDASAWDRAQGCLLGLAIGEALGSAAEFLPRGGYPELTELVGGGPLELAPGEWTDGTAMAICLAQSIIATRTVEQYDFMRRMAGWLTRGENSVGGACVGIGETTRAALERFLKDDEPSAGTVNGAAAGNGSLIRLAPLAIHWAKDSDLARFFASKQSRATHATIECLDACELFTAQLVDALAGADKSAATRPRIMRLATNALAINGGEWKEKSRDEIRASGYVIDTLEAGLWSVWHSDNFRDAIVLAANLGGDAAGVAAVAGQLAGALYGVSSIPAAWLETVAWREQLEHLAKELVVDEAVESE